jgi:hypothetical protein
VSRFNPMRSSMAEFGERYPMQTIEAHPHTPVAGE